MTNRLQRMHDKLNDALTPTALEIIDNSADHAGHAGAETGLGHYTVKITSPQFAGQSTLAQHRMVYTALGDMMQTDIHALIIQASV